METALYASAISACLLVGICAILAVYRLGDIYAVLCEIADWK